MTNSLPWPQAILSTRTDCRTSDRYCSHSVAQNRHRAVHFGVASNHRRYEADDVEITLCPPQLEDQSFVETILRDLPHFVIGRCLCLAGRNELDANQDAAAAYIADHLELTRHLS